jgi:hypothetical protein
MTLPIGKSDKVAQCPWFYEGTEQAALERHLLKNK